ncbi:hypothetical protein Syun_030597 [Stephania yunnanensis]|uniref:Beta-galactosidase galactose-binding domain-containing protein n=1 Tax=Stephania yunnanensis TaxID=152371 RepID=A0AAP0E1R7_9MAGN
MGKGQAWVNGHNIGRFWSLVAPKDGCQETCDYRGAYNENICAKNCGKLTQKWYHVPRSWLKSSDNLLVIFEETGGNPLGISVNLHYTRPSVAVYQNLTILLFTDGPVKVPSTGEPQSVTQHRKCSCGATTDM